MQRLKKISLILLISCLSACNSPKIRNLPQRNLRLVLETDQNGRRYINEDESACFERNYKHSKEYIGSVGQESINDVLLCNDLIGYESADYVDLADFFEEIRKKINKAKKRKK